ncbi:MAG: DUF3077 domain-containing protein [Dechloromonas sp.]|jgi:hypothetical protein|nr:DUF3077 domain-containing protein [Dechloromonas sp.]
MPENQRSTAVDRKTRAVSFLPCAAPDRSPLFSINPGIDLSVALAEASDMLAACKAVVENIVMNASPGGDGARFWSAFYLVEMSHAVVKACELAANQEEE